MRSEVLASFLLLSLALPPSIAVSAPIGILSSLHRFDVINKLKLLFTALLFVGPAVVSLFTSNLLVVVGVLTLSRILCLASYSYACQRVCRFARRELIFKRSVLREALGFGGPVAVTHLVSPFLLSLDRFLIGALISTKAVAYYSTPSEVLTRLWGIPGAVVGVLFPAFAVTIDIDRERAAVIYDWGVKLIFAMVFPIALTVVAFSPELLALWLGKDFSVQASGVSQILTIGLLLYSLAHVPAELINAAGRPAFTMKLRLLELIPYLLLAWPLISRFGIAGAAIAWSLRILVDTYLLSAFSRGMLAGTRRTGRELIIVGAIGTGVLLLGIALQPLVYRAVYFVLSLSVVLSYVILRWVGEEEREFMEKVFRRARR